jgi:signal transduction histidine kinase
VPDFDRAVSLACHDLRTPLATITGFAKTLLRNGELDERSSRYLGMIDGAADQLAVLLDELGLLARIEGGRYEPGLVGADTLELAGPGATGSGTQIETDVPALRRALAALAVAATRHGGIERTRWTVDGRRLELAPVNAAAAPIVLADNPRDFGALVARRVIDALGGSLVLDGETLRVSL